MDPDTKEQIEELKANIEDAKNEKIPWNTMVSITKIFSSTFERSNILNSLLLNQLKEYKILQTDLRNENQRLKEIARIAEELVKASAKAVEGKKNYSSELRGLCLIKCSSKMLQSLLYFWNTKTHTEFLFHAALLLLNEYPAPWRWLFMFCHSSKELWIIVLVY